MILATLVLQGLILGPLIAALSLRGESEADKLAELRARLDAARVALDTLERLGDDGRVSPESQETMREYYEGNIQLNAVPRFCAAPRGRLAKAGIP